MRYLQGSAAAADVVKPEHLVEIVSHSNGLLKSDSDLRACRKRSVVFQGPGAYSYPARQWSNKAAAHQWKLRQDSWIAAQFSCSLIMKGWKHVDDNLCCSSYHLEGMGKAFKHARVEAW